MRAWRYGFTQFRCSINPLSGSAFVSSIVQLQKHCSRDPPTRLRRWFPLTFHHGCRMMTENLRQSDCSARKQHDNGSFRYVSSRAGGYASGACYYCGYGISFSQSKLPVSNSSIEKGEVCRVQSASLRIGQSLSRLDGGIITLIVHAFLTWPKVLQPVIMPSAWTMHDISFLTSAPTWMSNGRSLT